MRSDKPDQEAQAEEQAAANAPADAQSGAEPDAPQSAPAPLKGLLAREEEEATSDTRMAQMLAAISRRFKPGQIFAIPLWRAALFLLTGFLCMAIQTLSMNMFQNNMPQVQAHYGASTVDAMWLFAAYMAPYASFTVLLVKIRTHIGMRPFTFIAFFCFIACSALETQFSDYNTALFMRFLSGLTTAPISSIGILYMIEPFVPQRKVTAGVSLAMMCIAMGTPAARIIAPYLVEDGNVGLFYFFMLGLACVTLAFMHFLRLTPMPAVKVLEKLDFISFPLFAAALGLNAALLSVGKYYWWTAAPWIGVCFVIAAASFVAMLLIELNRKTPLINFRWLFSWNMLHITLVMFTFRLLISDQSSILSLYFSYFNLQNDQLVTLYLFVALGVALGGAVCCVAMKPGGGDYLYLLGSGVIAIASYYDSFSTAATRPQDMYFSQMLIGFGTALFMAVSFSKGMLAALLRQQPQYITSWAAAFLFTQSTGGLIGSAFFGTLQIYFEKFHSYILTQYLALSDSQVAARVGALGRSYSAALTDKAQISAQGLASLAKQATLQANVLAYNDVFRIYAVIALALFCLLLIRIFLKTCLSALAARQKAQAAPQTA